MQSPDISRAIDAINARVPDTSALQDIPEEVIRLSFPLTLDEPATDQDTRRVARVLGREGWLRSPLYADYEPQEVRASLDTHGEALPSEIGDETKGIIVGTGPAAIVAGRTLREIGILDVTYISPDDEAGGIWASDSPWGQPKDFGYNNPGNIRAFGKELQITPERRTEDMQTFLQEITDPEMPQKKIKGEVTGIEFAKGAQNVYFQNEHGEEDHLPADFVIVGTGNKPLPLEGGYISLESDSTSDKINRWPNLLTTERIQDMDRRDERILCIGWGNSTMSKIREIEEQNRELGTNVEVVVLSHFPSGQLFNPYGEYLQPDGEYRSIARNPQNGEFTKLELDLADSRERYFRNLHLKFGGVDSIVAGTIDGVTTCQFVEQKGERHALVTTQDHVSGEPPYVIPNIGEVDAFIGYGNDPRLMRDLGFEVVDDYRGTMEMRPFDGKAHCNRRVYALGAAAWTRDNPSARVIPGILPMAGEIAFSVALDAARKYNKRK